MSYGTSHLTKPGWPVLLAALYVLALGAPAADAKSSRTKAPAGAPSAIANAPVCDMMSHPKIDKVAPDTVRPGQKVTIKGTNFGRKECFLGVHFGTTKAAGYTLVNDGVVEATVPNLKPGLTQVNLATEAGASQYVLLITGK